MYQFVLKGVVQGIGFRPYLFRACQKARLRGYVQNIGTGVVVVVDNKEIFLSLLQQAPPLVRIDSYTIKEIPGSFQDFTIRQSEGEGFAEIPPDLFLCQECHKELKDKKNRRCNYFFITCTNCGPRFSITKKNPYDRHSTTMDSFPLCSLCKKEYTEPKDRRYHAQTIACHECGPRLSLFYKGRQVTTNQEFDVIKQTAHFLKKGEIVAIKGIGGFHLACILEPKGINKLREITGRKHKPYAVMCRDIDMVHRIANTDLKEEELLLSVQRPIVVLKKKQPLLEVSELDTIGVMLPYTALHYLLFDFVDEPLVMTSANIADEPITTEDDQQFVDTVLTHSRVIHNPVDDSVVKVIRGKPLFLRRSRGFVPQSIPLASESQQQLLALGAELYNTFCVYKNGRATMSQYMGTTSKANTFEYYKKMVQNFLQYTHVKPTAIISDLHPNYNTTLFGEELSQILNIPLVKVQHHKAHAYAIAAEHGFKDFTAIVCDGLGYGEDNTLWGGEIFSNTQRVGHLECQYQLGGDSATLFPGKMLFSILSKFLSTEQIRKYVKGYSAKELMILKKQLDQKFNCVLTSSCGRVFDAAAYLLGFCNERTYEGRPAMLLETHSTKPYPLEPIIDKNRVMTTPLFEYLIQHIHQDKRRLAATVQQYMAEGLYQIASKFKRKIVFGGGCAYNRIMTSYMLKQGVYINQSVPCGDGGISFGQVAYVLANPRNNIA